MNGEADPAPGGDVREARRLFPATDQVAYFNTAATGLASRTLVAAAHRYVDDWAAHGLDYVRGEAAADTARASVADLIGADPADVALIASVSAAAGLVASQFGPAAPGQNVIIGEREYSSNHFPWRLLAHKGYDVRQVPFRHGGLEPDEIAPHVDGGTVLVAFSGVQTATGHRSDIPAISALAREVGAIVFVDGSQLVGALPVADDLAAIDVLATADHKFLLNAGRGLGYCYLSREVQGRFVADQRRLEGRPRPVRQLLRSGDGPLAHGVALRQLDQLAGRGRQRGGAVGLRGLRRRRHLPPEPRVGRGCSAPRWPTSAGRRSTSPRPTGAPSCRSPWATPTRRSSWRS